MSEFWRTVRKKEALTVFAISGAENWLCLQGAVVESSPGSRPTKHDFKKEKKEKVNSKLSVFRVTKCCQSASVILFVDYP